MTDAEWFKLCEVALGANTRQLRLTYIQADQIRREAWRRVPLQRHPPLENIYDLASALDRIIQNLTGIQQA